MAQLSGSQYNTDRAGRMYAYAVYPSAKVFKESKGSAWHQHLLFGDYITISDTEIVNGRVKVSGRGNIGWMNADQIQPNKILEVNFVDIGQGDGCHVVTPDDRQILIDAGVGDLMARYLVWRFNLYRKTNALEFKFTAVISHSDLDHYLGFKYIFDNDKLRFDYIYHNGIVERPGDKHPLGTVKDGYITSLVSDNEGMHSILSNPGKLKGANSTYVQTLFSVLQFSPEMKFQMLSEQDGFLPPYDRSFSHDGKEFSIEVLGPVVEEFEGNPALRFFKDAGKSKNGQSVILKITYGKARILLGGDLNEEAGKYLVKHYGDLNQLDKFRVDVAKACHHGSPHFHDPFLYCMNAAATVISSGDEESYGHPRPDALGAIGKSGYGDRPLIFSTELARSNKEINRKALRNLETWFSEIESLESKQLELDRQIKDADKKDKEKIQNKMYQTNSKLREKNKLINSFLTKFGMINLRTDGERMVLAQKLEVQSASSKWDIHKLEYSTEEGRMVRVK